MYFTDYGLDDSVSPVALPHERTLDVGCYTPDHLHMCVVKREGMKWGLVGGSKVYWSI